MILLRVRSAQAQSGPNLTKNTTTVAKIYYCGPDVLHRTRGAAKRDSFWKHLFIETKNVYNNAERQLFVLANNYRYYGYSRGGHERNDKYVETKE